MWVHPLSGGGTLDATLVWGRNRIERKDYDSWLLEGEVSAHARLTHYTRLEYVEKNAEELVLPPAFPEDRTFPLRQATLGTVYDLPVGSAVDWGLGAQVTANFTPRDLEGVYGKDPGGWSVFLRVRPRPSSHGMVM